MLSCVKTKYNTKGDLKIPILVFNVIVINSYGMILWKGNSLH